MLFVEAVVGGIWVPGSVLSYQEKAVQGLAACGTHVFIPEKPEGSTLSSTSGLSLREQLERQGEIHSSTEDEA